MQPETIILLPILIPLVFGLVIVPLCRKKPVLAASLAFLAVVLSAMAYWRIAGDFSIRFVQPWLGQFELSFSLTQWKGLLLGFALVFQLMTGVYVMRYVRRLPRPAMFLMFTLVAFASAAGVILTDNLLVLLVAWEIFLVALYALIHSGGPQAHGTALKALIIGGSSDFLMILGLLLFFDLHPAQTIGAHIQVGGSFQAFASFFLLFLGAGAKAGMFPFHTWIPDAAEVMPAPGFAALPASHEKLLGIYFLFLITHEMFTLNATAQTLMYIFAVVTVFVSIVPALVEKNLRRVLALTAIAPVGFMIAGLATSEIAGMAGALILMLTHATYKSTMFFCAGNLEEESGSPMLEKIQGLAWRMPLTALGFVLAFTAAVSLPPTGGFMSKELIFEGLVERGHYAVFILLWLGAILIMAVFCKLMGVLWSATEQRARVEGFSLQTLPVLLLGLGAVMSGAIFNAVAPAFNAAMGTADSHWVSAMWHLSPLTMASYCVYLFGLLLFLAFRLQAGSSVAAFDSLNDSPVLGRTLQLAREKKLDGYEIFLKVIHWLAGVVFYHFERWIDRVADSIIRIGQGITRPALSGIHNGLYSNYLGWVLAGFAFVVAMVFLNH